MRARDQAARSTRWWTTRSPRPIRRRRAEAELADVYAPPSAIAPHGRPRRRRCADAAGDCATSTRSPTGCARRCARDDRVVLLGQDIAEYGGVFKVTEGFVEEFGKARVRNTPIIESGAIGAALGLALDGFRPMVEMQFGDFITCGFNQIVNNLAKTHYRWGAARAGRAARADRRRHGRGAVPLAERRGVVHARRRA